MSGSPSNVIGLGKERKARARAERKREADANTVKFGRTKAEKTLDATTRAKARKSLDDHKKTPE